MVTLNTDYARYATSTAKLMDIHVRAQGIEVEYQKLIAETLLLRLFYELDQCVEGVILKLIRGAKYLDGSAPLLLRTAFRSQDAARQHIIGANRARGHRAYYLEWTTLAKVNQNLNGIVDPSDHFLVTRNIHDGTYEEMRHVRNHVAHNTPSTRARFSTVAQGLFTSTAGISPARLLLSKRRAICGYSGNEMVIAQYIKWSKTFVKTLTKSPV